MSRHAPEDVDVPAADYVHVALDAAVAAAYDWNVETAEEEVLRELRERNRSLGTLQRGTGSQFRRPRQRDSGSGGMR